MDCLNLFKDTPLILAIEKNHEELAIMLVEMGANLNIMGRNCQTPLMISCEKNFTKLAKMIASIDSKLISEKNILGETSIQIAERNRNDDLVHYLYSLNPFSSRVNTANSKQNKKLIK